MAAVTTSIKLELEMRDRLSRLSEIRQRAVHWLMTEAIRQYVEKEEQREGLRQDALAAWRDFELTGLHVSHAEADAWMARLEAGEQMEPPACHV